MAEVISRSQVDSELEAIGIVSKHLGALTRAHKALAEIKDDPIAAAVAAPLGKIVAAPQVKALATRGKHLKAIQRNFAALDSLDGNE